MKTSSSRRLFGGEGDVVPQGAELGERAAFESSAAVLVEGDGRGGRVRGPVGEQVVDGDEERASDGDCGLLRAEPDDEAAVLLGEGGLAGLLGARGPAGSLDEGAAQPVGAENSVASSRCALVDVV